MTAYFHANAPLEEGREEEPSQENMTFHRTQLYKSRGRYTHIITYILKLFRSSSEPHACILHIFCCLDSLEMVLLTAMICPKPI